MFSAIQAMTVDKSIDAVRVPSSQNVGMSDLDKFFDDELAPNTANTQTLELQSIKQQIANLKNSARLPLKTNILQVWRDVKYKTPDLYKLAMTVLGVP